MKANVPRLPKLPDSCPKLHEQFHDRIVVETSLPVFLYLKLFELHSTATCTVQFLGKGITFSSPGKFSFLGALSEVFFCPCAVKDDAINIGIELPVLQQLKKTEITQLVICPKNGCPMNA